jgi:DNA-binding winged helix-turn-helix (wHTH) protein
MRFHFNPFTLDQDARQLFRSNEVVHLSPKAFELLKALLESRPRALSKPELHARLWPDTFVSDANLAILIREIRTALDDDARAPRFVRTVHGFGYAFSGIAVEGEQTATVQSPRQATFWLIGAGQKFALVEGDHLVGRSPESSVWLDLPGVSRVHAFIRIGRSAVTLEDRGSTNGTFVGGNRVDGPIALRDGDKILFGPVTMTFRRWSPNSGTETQDLSDAASQASC